MSSTALPKKSKSRSAQRKAKSKSNKPNKPPPAPPPPPPPPPGNGGVNQGSMPLKEKPESDEEKGIPPVKEIKEVKLKPRYHVDSSTSVVDCCVLLVHCAEHKKMLVSSQESASWLPFVQLHADRSWKDSAIIAFCLSLCGSKNQANVDDLLASPPLDTFKCLQVLRIQLPQTQQFVARLVYYFKLSNLKPSNYKCCKRVSNSIDWLPVEEVCKGKVRDLWGPELVQFAALLKTPDDAVQSIAEYSLDEAYQFVPRDPPQNIEEAMLKSLGITNYAVERLYEDYLEHCFPSLYLSPSAFKTYLAKYDINHDEFKSRRMFRAFDASGSGALSFHELLLGLACTEPRVQHGEFRARFIFRFYSKKPDAMTPDELSVLAKDIGSNLKDALAAIGGTGDVSLKSFITAIGTHRFRGTSKLCRSSKSFFTLISRLIAQKVAMSSQSAGTESLSRVMLKRDNKEVCPTCQEKNYAIATHLVIFDDYGNQTNRPIHKFSKAKPYRMTHQQYSLECVFNKTSAANITIKLIRAFAQNKGTTAEPKGLMEDRKGLFYKLLLALEWDVEMLLDAEFKCQKTYSPCYIIGDTHGNLEDLLSLEYALWKQMPCNAANFLFLGDYVDRGKWGLEVSLYLIAFKILCPNKVTLLRGNHEVRKLQKHYTYFKECIEKYGETFGIKVFELTNIMYDKLPVCGLVDEAIWGSHGGIPRSAKTINQIEAVKKSLRDPQEESAIAWEILWSDPCPMHMYNDICAHLRVDSDSTGGFVTNVKRGTAWLFNEVGASGFLRSNFLTHIVRAHEVAQIGYEFNFGTKCCTIFSCSHYCGNNNTCGFILADNERMRIITLDTTNNSSATDG